MVEFTIEVRGKKGNEGFCDLELFHKECYGGKIKIVRGICDLWELICLACCARVVVNEGRETVEITQTAIDGKERKIGGNHEVAIIRKS
jgi:hypothetical protein